jgi:hypothetical protein
LSGKSSVSEKSAFLRRESHRPPAVAHDEDLANVKLDKFATIDSDPHELVSSPAAGCERFERGKHLGR